MTINKQAWLNQFPGTPSANLRRELSTLIAEACLTQQGEVEEQTMSSYPRIAAEITPLDDAGEPGQAYPVEIDVWDERGITFHHQLPLSARRALVQVDGDEADQRTAEVDLAWCRFNRMGHYTSGGRFVRNWQRTA